MLLELGQKIGPQTGLPDIGLHCAVWYVKHLRVDTGTRHKAGFDAKSREGYQLLWHERRDDRNLWRVTSWRQHDTSDRMFFLQGTSTTMTLDQVEKVKRKRNKGGQQWNGNQPTQLETKTAVMNRSVLFMHAICHVST